jgi:hypothetical protein
LKIWLKVEKMKDESLLLSKLIPSNPIPYSSIPIPLGCKVYLRTKKKMRVSPQGWRMVF